MVTITNYKFIWVKTISKLTEFLGITFSTEYKNTACVVLYSEITLSREMITRTITSEYTC